MIPPRSEFQRLVLNDTKPWLEGLSDAVRHVIPVGELEVHTPTPRCVCRPRTKRLKSQGGIWVTTFHHRAWVELDPVPSHMPEKLL